MNGQKIKLLRNEKGWSQADLAKFAGVSTPTIKLYESNKTSPTVSILQKLSKAFNIEIATLLDDDLKDRETDKMSVSQEKRTKCPLVQEETDKMSIVPMDKVSIEDNLTEVPMSDLIQIPLLHHISASAGQGAINELPAEIEYRGFTKEILRESFGVLGGYQDIFIIHSFGNSMFPTIPLKALLLVQKGNPLEGQICVARIGGEMLVKRLAKFPKIRLLSDNKEYEPITISEEMDFEVIGRVVGYFGVL